MFSSVTVVLPNATEFFTPLATGLNFGIGCSISSLRGQSEMTFNGMPSDPHIKIVNSLDLILMSLSKLLLP